MASVVVYGRISTHEGRQHLATQLHACGEYASKRGYKVLGDLHRRGQRHRLPPADVLASDAGGAGTLAASAAAQGHRRLRPRPRHPVCAGLRGHPRPPAQALASPWSPSTARPATWTRTAACIPRPATEHPRGIRPIRARSHPQARTGGRGPCPRREQAPGTAPDGHRRRCVGQPAPRPQSPPTRRRAGRLTVNAGPCGTLRGTGTKHRERRRKRQWRQSP